MGNRKEATTGVWYLLCFILLLHLTPSSSSLSSHADGGRVPLLRRPKPDPSNAAATARWLAAENDWGVLSTISSELGGAPFGNVVSFSDGLPGNGHGIPYFYLTTLDPTARNALKDARSSLTISEFPLGTCGRRDPENPTCSKLTLTGKLKLIDSLSKEAEFARQALFSKHSEMKSWPADHNFQIFTLEIEDLFLIDWFGGPKPLSVVDYLNQKVDGMTTDDSNLTTKVSREVYANIYGPTVGDKIRLGDTNLFAEVERDFTVYGDECKFGGGKVLRDGMGQAAGYPVASCLDTVVTNALIIDYTGIYKADIGIKDGKISSIGKAGNPDVMDGVQGDMIVGVNTEVIAAEGMIVTAGGIDCHVHFICPQLAQEAISSGITTLVGGGTGPAHGTRATTCTPAPIQMQLMLQSTDDLPLNFGFTGKGNSAKSEGLREIIEAGAIGLKLHEDWGSTPAAIDKCLAVAEEYDIQVNIHTDTLNESGCVEHTIDAFKGRTIHTYHSEGAGGGHAPDIIKVCGIKNVLPSSTNPTRPFTSNTIDEHLDMLMVCHHLDKNISEDVAFAESRIRAETIAAEDILHDIGAISIISSDSQAMGRIGEVITRTWQTAHKMKLQRGNSIEPMGGQNDNFRIKRYIAKYTINPAIANGLSHLLGSVEKEKLADLVVWKPSFFGSKPEMVIKGGFIAWADMGDPNASIPTPEPVFMRPMFGAYGRAGSNTSVAFVSKAAKEADISKLYGLKKRVEAVKHVRGLTKLDMKLNDALPHIEVDPETYQVTADGELLTCEPISAVPLSQNYYLF